MVHSQDGKFALAEAKQQTLVMSQQLEATNKQTTVIGTLNKTLTKLNANLQDSAHEASKQSKILSTATVLLVLATIMNVTLFGLDIAISDEANFLGIPLKVVGVIFVLFVLIAISGVLRKKFVSLIA